MGRTENRIPLAVKALYTLFMVVLVPVYLVDCGATNFLYFCDQALLLTLAGLWLESPLLISMCAVGILAPQVLWILDVLGNAIGHPITGMTDDMFDADRSLLLRGLSGFHGRLPVLLVYLVRRLGYDPRARPWTILAWVRLATCFVLMPPPSPDAGLTPVNINDVWGTSDRIAQPCVPAWAWLAGLVAGFPIALFLPTHRVLRRLPLASLRGETPSVPLQPGAEAA